MRMGMLGIIFLALMLGQANTTATGQEKPDGLSQEEAEIIQNLEILQELEVLENIDLLESYETIKDMKNLESQEEEK